MGHAVMNTKKIAESETLKAIHMVVTIFLGPLTLAAVIGGVLWARSRRA